MIKKITNCNLLIFLTLFSSCQQVHQGYNFKFHNNLIFKEKVDNIDSVKSKMGEPTFYRNSDKSNKSFCYLSASGERFLFYRFNNAKYNIMCFKFDKFDKLESQIYKKDFEIKDYKFIKEDVEFNKLANRKVGLLDKLFSKFNIF